MLKGSLDEKDPKFFMKNKIYPVVIAWEQQSDKKYCSFKSLCCKSNRHFAAKTKLELDQPSIITEAENRKMVTREMFLAKKIEK